MKAIHSFFLLLLLALALSMSSSFLGAQVNPAGKPVTIRGKITAVNGQELLVAATNGEVSVNVPAATTIRADVAVKLSDVTAGTYLGTTAQKQPDGTFRASEVHIFSEDQRGFSEGHRPSSSVPNSTMTNANVEKVEEVVVQDVKGPMMTLKYKGGEVKVFVPPDTPIVRRLLADRAVLKPGAEVLVQATQAPDGSISASQITVRASENNAPM